MQEAVNGTAKEECDCTHGAYGGFSDVPSHEIRDFTLRVRQSSSLGLDISHHEPVLEGPRCPQREMITL